LTLRHHDLCFGCGIANVFGLQMELERAGEGRVEGRFFVKQDHQGPPGIAHGGIIGAALDEAMALCVHAEGVTAVTRSFAVDLHAPVPIGEFVQVEAHVADRDENRLVLRASASGHDEERRLLAEAEAVFAPVVGFT
jgi:acyl-coenzyme A thioesterase PaaI-like protein